MTETIPTWGYEKTTGKAVLFDAPGGKLPPGCVDTPAKCNKKPGRKPKRKADK